MNKLLESKKKIRIKQPKINTDELEEGVSKPEDA